MASTELCVCELVFSSSIGKEIPGRPGSPYLSRVGSQSLPSVLKRTGLESSLAGQPVVSSKGNLRQTPLSFSCDRQCGALGPVPVAQQAEPCFRREVLMMICGTMLP